VALNDRQTASMDPLSRARTLAQQATTLDSSGLTVESIPVYEECVQLLRQVPQGSSSPQINALATRYAERASVLRKEQHAALVAAGLITPTTSGSTFHHGPDIGGGQGPSAAGGSEDDDLARRLADLSAGTSGPAASPPVDDFEAKSRSLGLKTSPNQRQGPGFLPGMGPGGTEEDEVARIMREAMDSAALSDSEEEEMLKAGRASRGDLGPAPAPFEFPGGKPAKSKRRHKSGKKPTTVESDSTGSEHSSGDLHEAEFQDREGDTEFQRREKEFYRAKAAEQRRQKKAAYKEWKRHNRF
jgi:hypothetical protein